MKLTIVPSDKFVSVDGVGKSPLSWSGTPENVHALQWADGFGEIELKDPTQNVQIDSLPDWANNAVQAWQDDVPPTPPEPQPPTPEQNKILASSLLSETDWTTIPDVADATKSNPYLGNTAEFLTYRNILRNIAIDPPAGEVQWPTKPIAQWIKA